jgi:hypothetical protein
MKKSKVAHGPRRRPNIQRISGCNQDHAQVLEFIECSQITYSMTSVSLRFAQGKLFRCLKP